jgi:hypothetical protein
MNLSSFCSCPDFVMNLIQFCEITNSVGARNSVVVEALCYNPEGHGSETQ